MDAFEYIKDEFRELKKMPFFWARLICFSILFALDELTVTHYTSPYLYYFIGALAVFFIPSVVMQALALDRVGAKLKMSKPLFLWLVLGGIATVNEVSYGLLNGVTPIYQGAVFWFFIPVLAYCGQEKGFYKLFLLSCCAPILFDLISGFVLFPFKCNIYALALTGFFPILLSFLQILLEKKQFIGAFVSLAGLVTTLFLLYISQGRTGFIACLLSISVFAVIVYMAKRAKRKNIIYKESALSVLSCVLILLFVGIIIAFILYSVIFVPSLPTPDSLEEPTNMFDKFIFSLQTKNLFSGRGTIWIYTFDNISAIGNGPFFYMGDAGHFHAHNSFIAVLGHYGIVPAVLYCIFFLWAFTTSAKYCFRGRHLRFLPFIVIFTYFVSSMAEDIACIVVPRMFAVLFYFSCAILINEYPKCKMIETKRKKNSELYFR